MSGQPATRLHDAIGRYRILKELGRGMMGVVYLAQDPALERLVALKTIDLAFAVPENERAAFEQRFLAEARVAARLQHPGIVVVHDVGRDETRGILYIALEYLSGRTLADLCAGGQEVPWPEALRIVASVARALHHAHAQSIVHRDIKPANVMLLPSGQPKIMDFGIAKVPHLELTSAGQFFGTPLYMSPEQANGEAVDGRADLFSLGAVAYQLVTGRQAFKAENVVQVLARVVNHSPPPPSSLVPGTPSGVDRILARAMAKAPERRYPSGEDMAADIDRLLANPSLEATADLPDLALDEETPLAAVLDQPAPSPPRPTSTRASLAEPLPVPHAEPPKGRGPLARRPALWLLAAAALATALAVPALRARRADASRRPADPPARAERDAPGDAPAAQAPSAEEPAADGDGKLEVDFEHHLRSGRLQVWVDDDAVLDEQLDSRVARKILSLRLRKGEVQQVLPVPAGRHEVRVRLQWSDKVRTGRITGTFAAGQTRTLRVRVSRIFNDLSVDWD